MMYAIFFLAALLQSAAYIRLIAVSAGWQPTKKIPLLGAAVLLNAAAQMLFVIPGTMIIPVLQNPAVRVAVLVLLMLGKAGCFAAVFRQRFRRMLYISVLSFVINSNYTNILLLFTQDQLLLNTLACVIEAAVIGICLLWMRCRHNAPAVSRALQHFSPRLYLMILAFLLFMSFFEYTTVRTEFNGIARVLILPVVIFTAYIMMRVMKVNAEAREHEQISQLLSVQLENQVEYYKKIETIYNEFREFRHDFKNHLLCLRSLLAENEVSRACEYMDDIEQMSLTRKSTFDTGNIIVNALLSDKTEKAAQHHTKIQFSGYAPTVGITNADLCTILANAVDNAIEACAKDGSGQEKEIRIHSDFQQGYFFLKITNPVFERVEVRNGNQLRTTKTENPSMHGFGVANIVRTAKKYDGDAAISADEHLFTLELNLWLKPV